MTAEAPEYFFSYCRTDSEFVLKLAKKLRESGADLWLDQLDILGGDKWDAAIERALKRCHGMIVVLSPDAVASENFLDEVSYGLEEGKKVIPILYRECHIPFRLRRVHHVDFTSDYEGAYTALLRTLELERRPDDRSFTETQTVDRKGTRERLEETPSSGSREDVAVPSFSGAGVLRIGALTLIGTVIGALGGWAEKALSDPWQLTLGLLISVVVLSAIALAHHGRRPSPQRILKFELEALGLWAGYTVAWSMVNRWWDDFYVMTILIWVIVALLGGAALSFAPRRQG